MYEQWYRNISAPFRSAGATHAVNVLDKALVYFIAAVYLGLAAWFVFTQDARAVRFVAVPAATFVIVTVVRALVNAPRPYEVCDIDPIIKKDTHGKSMPSRHIASAVIIACALAWVNVPAGIAAFACCIVVGFCRVVGGVHFPCDVVAAAAISLACGALGFLVF